MPELPEIELLRTTVESTVKGCSITSIIFQEQGSGPREGHIDDLVLVNSIDQFESALLGQKLLGAGRKGKYLWFTVASNHTVLFHFGMTGSFVIQGNKVPTYNSFSISETWPPKFTKLEMRFSNGKRLAFVDPRRLGRVTVLNGQPYECEPVMSLARDPYLEGMPSDVLQVKLSKYTAPIKAILLDQRKVCCGIGNYIADEVLYQSTIHPESPANALSPKAVKQLSIAIEEVINTAVAAHADSKQFPKDWIFHCRWNKGKKAGTTIYTRQGNQASISFITVGGRTSAIVPTLQKIVSKKVPRVVKHVVKSLR
ncbi:FPG1 [Symbiodinium microadriaticum]|nr:FPG1 [Symbiodinium microadriaticum]